MRSALPAFALAALSALACSDVAAPVPEATPRFDEVAIDREGPVQLESFVTGCRSVVDETTPTTRGCTIMIGETKVIGWFISGGAVAVGGIRSSAQLRMLVGPAPSDTIPGPPSYGGVRSAFGSGGTAALNAFVAAAGFSPLSDTIPGPPSKFIFAQRNAAGELEGDALILLGVDELVAKKALGVSETGTEFALAWSDASGTSYLAAGRLPPSDTIPGPVSRSRK